MWSPVVRRIVYYPDAFVERRLKPSSEGQFLVEGGKEVMPFDFVASVKDGLRRKITAGVPGKVVKILPQKALLIRTEALVLRGVSGAGEDDEGEIRVVAGPSETVRSENLSKARAGTILVGGNVSSLEVLRKAEALGARGMVVGGAHRIDLEKAAFPLLLITGFGTVPMPKDVFDFLSSVEGRHAFLSAGDLELLVSRFSDHKEDGGELFSGRAQRDEEREFLVRVKKGDKAQIFGGPHFGKVGMVERVSGEFLRIKLDEGDIITAPGRNVGIIR